MGKVWPQPVTGTRRKVWDRAALDRAINEMPGAVDISNPETRAEMLHRTADARREAWEEKERVRNAKIAKKWADAKWVDKP